MNGAGGAITRELTGAGLGAWRLIWYDPRWPDGFTPTVGGFVRSFLGAFLGLPFYLVATAAMFRNGEAGPISRDLWVAALSFTLNTLAFPLLIGVLARPLKIGAGFAGFVIIINWASLFVSAVAAAASVLTFGGEVGRNMYAVAWMMMFCLSLFVVWRAARETLGEDIPVAVLMVVLTVAIGFATDQLSRLAITGSFDG